MGKAKTILLIARNMDIIKEFEQMLSSDYDLMKAGSDIEGMEMLESHLQDIAAVLIELSVARENGFYMAEHMKSLSPFDLVPMIAISPDAPTADDMDCIDRGFFDVLSQKIPQPLLLKRISNAILARDSMSLSSLERMLHALPSCIFLKDTEGKYVFSTQYWHHLKNHEDENPSIRGKTDLEIRRDRQNAIKAMEADKKIIETGEGTDYMIEENEDGVREYLQLIKRPVFDENGNITGIIALINDVTDRQLLKMELEHRAKTDTLSRLLNRGATEELVSRILSNQINEEELSALLMIDIDDFKIINDTYGHARGDLVIADVGKILASNIRSTDVAGRVGGDEFLVFLRGIGSKSAATRVARLITEQVQKGVTFSIGIAFYPEHGKQFEDLYRAADRALYYIKNHGKAACKVYEDGIENNE